MSAPLTPETIYNILNGLISVQVGEIYLSPGQNDGYRILGMEDAAEQIAQHTAAQDERIKELEKQITDNANHFREYIDKQDASIAELENQLYAVTEGSQQWEQECSDLKRDKTELLEKVEQLEKERDTSRFNHSACEEALSKVYKQWQDVFKERDQAFDLLKDWAKEEDFDFTENPDDELSDLGQIFKRRNKLLSSRENKKHDE